MAETKVQVSWKFGPAPEAEPEQLWWEQPLQIAPDLVIWAAAPRAAWEHVGSVVLKAAGLETVEVIEARNTYTEILGQSLSSLARSIGAVLGREASCAPGREQAPEAMPETGATVSLKFSESVVHYLWIGFSSKLVAVVGLPPESRAAAQRVSTTAAPDGEQHPGVAGAPPTLDLLLDVELPVSISFGRTELPMKDVLKLTTGSIVELNRGVNDPVEVLVNRCLIARGEVVVVEGNYGVRIQQIASRQDRLRSIR
jgi:flagellar motor switch protein FliN/FliY